jgi:hypothetical protein
MASTLTRFEFYGCLLTRTSKVPYAAPSNSEEALHRRIVDDHSYPGISEQVRRSIIRRVEACIESHGGHFEHFYKCSL